MTILANDIPTTELGTGRPPLKLTAGIGYNCRLFKGGLWALQTQAVGTLSTGNAAITAIARGTVPNSFVVGALQAMSSALTHTYSGGILTIFPATNSGDDPISTAAEIVAYLKAQAPVMVDFLDFIAGGDGTGVLPVPSSGVNFLGGLRTNYWIPGSQSGLGILTYARGEDMGVDCDNRGGLPGANGVIASPATKSVTAERGTHAWRNDLDGTPLTSIFQVAYCLDDDTVSADINSTRGRVGLVTYVDPSGLYVEVNEEI